MKWLPEVVDVLGSTMYEVHLTNQLWIPLVKRDEATEELVSKDTLDV